ncbi:MAG TPA: DnaJ domain-containing protein [Pyrinomonadaceae bacterium]|nr:DnaJ domain-containing protein [Pyrinomonadaceae bacterium]
MDKYFEILGLKPGASQKEIKAAYRDLARVWHPDRFCSDPRLQAKAQEKLKEINEAYEKLRDYKCEPENVKSESRQQTYQQKPENAPPQAQTKPTETEPFSTLTNQNSNTSTSYLKAIWIIPVAIVILVLIGYNFRRTPEKVVSANTKSPDVNQSQKQDSNYNADSAEKTLSKNNLRSNANADVESKDNLVAENNTELETLELSLDEPTTIASVPSLTIIPSTPEKIVPSVTLQNQNASRQEGFFTIGSTKDEVLAIQGTPNRFTDSSFHYGSSVVNFRNGRVINWEIYYPKLKAKLISTTSSQSDYITVGSTVDDVLSIQGTPDRFTSNTFYYGSSQIRFNNNRVVSWEVYYPKLKVKMLTDSSTENGYFTIGSTKDDVIKVQGTPDRFTENSFHYGSSQVSFVNNRVTSWEVYYPKLKVKMKP